MSLPTPSDRLLALFAPWMAERGFTYRKKGHAFRREFEQGHQEFSLEFDGRGGFVTVHPAFSVDFHALAEIQTRLGWGTGQAGRALRNSGVAPDRFDLYLDEYMNMTPRQRKGITSETTHPQERIEAGVRFLQHAYAHYAEPAFDALRSEEQLADLYLRSLRGAPEPATPYLLEKCAMLLASRLEARRPELLEALGRRAPWTVMTRDALEEASTKLGIAMPVPEH